MSNAPVLATAEGMPNVSRRNALAITGGALALSLGALARSTIPAAAVTSEIDRLIADHREAWAASSALWAEAGDMAEAHPHPLPKVQYGRLIIGRDFDNGVDLFKPLFAYSEEHLREVQRRQTSDFDTPAMLAKREERTEQRCAELRAKTAAYEAFQAVCGIAAAYDKARAADEAANDMMAVLIDRPFKSVDEICTLAAYIVSSEAAGRNGCEEDTMLRLVKALAAREA